AFSTKTSIEHRVSGYNNGGNYNAERPLDRRMRSIVTVDKQYIDVKGVGTERDSVIHVCKSPERRGLWMHDSLPQGCYGKFKGKAACLHDTSFNYFSKVTKVTVTGSKF